MIADLFNLAGMIHLDERNATDQVNTKKVFSAYANPGDLDPYSTGGGLKNARRSAGASKKTYMAAGPKAPSDMTKDER